MDMGSLLGTILGAIWSVQEGPLCPHTTNIDDIAHIRALNPKPLKSQHPIQVVRFLVVCPSWAEGRRGS